MTIEYNFDLRPYNTFGIEVKARCFVEYGSESELQEFLTRHEGGIFSCPMLHIGEGSNLLFLKDYDGLILHSAIEGIHVESEDEHSVRVRVGGGLKHDSWVQYALEKGWYGLENLSLIPGEVGASAVQNIGAYGAEVSDYIVSVRGIHLQSGKVREWKKEECDYSYRHSIFKDLLKGQYAITYVTFKLNKHFVPNYKYQGLVRALQQRDIDLHAVTAQELRRIVIKIREDKLPDSRVPGQGNAGSFFMNPIIERNVYEHLRESFPQMPHYDVDEGHVKVPAGWLIEQCGWKGKSLGRVAVHDKQALILVNRGGAPGKEVAALSDAICQDVWKTFHITLHPEVNFI